jgi:hypothetical protein
MQPNVFLQSGYPETWGLQKNDDESILEFAKRVFSDDIVRNSNCFGVKDSSPYIAFQMNDYIKTFDHTYYFAMCSGERKNIRDKQRELFKEPSKIQNKTIGFDSDVQESIVFRNSTKQLRRRDQKNRITTFERI